METNPRPATVVDYYQNFYTFISCVNESAACILNGGWACIPKAMKETCFINDPTLCPTTALCTCCGGN